MLRIVISHVLDGVMSLTLPGPLRQSTIVWCTWIWEKDVKGDGELDGSSSRVCDMDPA